MSPTSTALGSSTLTLRATFPIKRNTFSSLMDMCKDNKREALTRRHTSTCCVSCGCGPDIIMSHMAQMVDRSYGLGKFRNSDRYCKSNNEREGQASTRYAKYQFLHFIRTSKHTLHLQEDPLLPIKALRQLIIKQFILKSNVLLCDILSSLSIGQ